MVLGTRGPKTKSVIVMRKCILLLLASVAVLGSSPITNATTVTTGNVQVTVGPEGGNAEPEIYLDLKDDTTTVIGHVGSLIWRRIVCAGAKSR